MPTLEEIIIANAPTVSLSKLFQPAQKAYKAPETGTTGITPAAARVIQDCALVTINYLPLAIFGQQADPFSLVAGKVTLEMIQDFYKRAHVHIHTYHLLLAILDRGKTVNITPTTTADPYGDYENIAALQSQDEINIMCTLFKVTT